APLSSNDADTQAALNLFKGWNATMLADSPQAALHEVWFTHHLGRAFKNAVLSKASAEAMGAPDTDVMLDTLEHPQGSERKFGEDPQQ
ncbi:hypothetical protein, partial [Klebsiella pneumoniae]